MLAVENGASEFGFIEQHFENALAFKLGRFSEVEPFQKQKIECVVDKPALLPCREIGL
jgi:hypothetical protein